MLRRAFLATTGGLLASLGLVAKPVSDPYPTTDQKYDALTVMLMNCQETLPEDKGVFTINRFNTTTLELKWVSADLNVQESFPTMIKFNHAPTIDSAYNALMTGQFKIVNA